MNAPVYIPGQVRPTQAAEGLPRRAFSVVEVERMVECGILHEAERLELMGGELVPMSPKGVRHETIKRLLLRAWRSVSDVDLLVETTVRTDDDTFIEPDLIVLPPDVPLKALQGPTVILAVEVADSSLGYDLHRKPAVYSRFGVPELWVVDAPRRETHVFLSPGDGGYARRSVRPGSDRLVSSLAPALVLCLDDLDVEWDAADLA